MSRDDIFWIFIFLVVFLVGVSVVVKQAENSNKADPPKYREEAYTLDNGTLCTIVHGGTQATNRVGITCNYNQHRIGGES
jgi:hypothetical protein